MNQHEEKIVEKERDVTATWKALDVVCCENSGYFHGSIIDPFVMCLRACIELLFDLKLKQIVWLCDELVDDSVLSTSEIYVTDLERWHESWYQLFKKHEAFKTTKNALDVEHSVSVYLNWLGMVQTTDLTWLYQDEHKGY
jgi:hypothetical protein